MSLPCSPHTPALFLLSLSGFLPAQSFLLMGTVPDSLTFLSLNSPPPQRTTLPLVSISSCAFKQLVEDCARKHSQSLLSLPSVSSSFPLLWFLIAQGQAWDRVMSKFPPALDTEIVWLARLVTGASSSFSWPPQGSSHPRPSSPLSGSQHQSSDE